MFPGVVAGRWHLPKEPEKNKRRGGGWHRTPNSRVSQTGWHWALNPHILQWQGKAFTPLCIPVCACSSNFRCLVMMAIRKGEQRMDVSDSLWPMGCSPLGSSYFLVHGILQAGILEWVTISSSGHLPDQGMEPASPALAGRFFTTEPPGKPLSVQWSQIKSWRQFWVE